MTSLSQLKDKKTTLIDKKNLHKDIFLNYLFFSVRLLLAYSRPILSCLSLHFSSPFLRHHFPRPASSRGGNSQKPALVCPLGRRRSIAKLSALLHSDLKAQYRLIARPAAVAPVDLGGGGEQPGRGKKREGKGEKE